MNKKVTDLDWLTMNTYICSDHHIGHKNITEFEPMRRTAMLIDGYEDHTEWIIDLHNETVSDDDIVLILGDIAFKNLDAINRMNGRKYLVMGNHDRKGSQTYKMFEGVISGEILLDYSDSECNDMLKYESEDLLLSGIVKQFGDEQYMFSHYPLFDNDEWDRKNKMIEPRIKKLERFYDSFGCSKNIHGHTHSNKSIFEDSVNVCLEHINFRPKKLKDLL